MGFEERPAAEEARGWNRDAQRGRLGAGVASEKASIEGSLLFTERKNNFLGVARPKYEGTR